MNVLIVVLEDFPGGDTRVRRQVAALRERGHGVTVMCATAYSGATSWLGCDIERTFTRRDKAGGLSRRFAEYIFFFVEAIFRIASISWRKDVDVIQVANMPDFLTLAAVPTRLVFRTPVILDMHDLMPELMASKRAKLGLFAWMLRAQESLGFYCADHVMTVNGICAGLLHARHPERVVTVIPNCPDPGMFVPRGFLGWSADEVVRIGYHGTVAARFGVTTLIQAIAKIQALGKSIQLDVWGGGDGLAAARNLVAGLNIDSIVVFHDQTPVDKMVAGLNEIHISIVPYDADEYMAIAYSTKAFELALLGIPMILSDLPGIREQFSPDAAIFFSPGSVESLSSCILEAIANPSDAKRRAGAARAEVKRFDWAAYGDAYVSQLIECVKKCGRV